MRDGCLVLCLDDEFESVKRQLRPADVVAPWHLRSPGGGKPCSYLFVRGATAQAQSSTYMQTWNTSLQTRMLQRMAAAPPRNAHAGQQPVANELQVRSGHVPSACMHARAWHACMHAAHVSSPSSRLPPQIVEMAMRLVRPEEGGGEVT